ncbi:putative armadillo-like helical protein [Helianthus debilis subsp. tardiflorus]
MEMEVGALLNNTLSADSEVRRSATQALEDLCSRADFPFTLISIAIENQGQSIAIALAAATYLKNFTRRTPIASKDFRDVLVRSLLQAQPPALLKLLVEAFRPIVDAEFVKHNSWPQLVPELRLVIEDSDLVVNNSRWKTVNALTLVQSLVRPFQYFLNPKLAKEPVPPQLELITQEILVPVVSLLHQFVQHLCIQHKPAAAAADLEVEKSLVIITKCIYYAVRSHMPSTLVSLLPSLCHDLIHILHSLEFQDGPSSYTLRFKTGKRSLLIFCALITRHRKFSDKLMPDIINSVVKLLNHKIDFSKLDNLSERVVSLAFDVISRLLETGPGWRLVSPHFSSLLETAIFPAIVMNEKDVTEWEEDSDEYIRKNLPSELEEISGWRDDLFTPRKSALNLLGVISISKGPPVVGSVTSKRKKGEKSKQKGRSCMGELLVLPYLSKFPIPNNVTNKTINDYYGVLMAYGSLVDFLTEQRPAYTCMLIRSRVLPLYDESCCHPYLVASANWILGELVSCIPQEMSSDVYSSLLKALVMEDTDISWYPVRVSAAAAIAQLAENEFSPPEWLPVLQIVVDRITGDIEEEEMSIMFELLKTLVEAGADVAPHIPHIISLLAQHVIKDIPLVPEPWPQVVERGFATLSFMAQYWEGSLPDDVVVATGRSTIAKAFTDLLQVAWRTSPAKNKSEVPEAPPSCCIDDSSTLLTFIISDVNENDTAQKLILSKLLLVWARLISNWDGWEEEEDSSIFSCIKEAAYLHRKVSLINFIRGSTSQHSILEGICGFVSNAFSHYPSVIYRAASSVHILVNLLTCSPEDQHIMHAVTASFIRAAFSCFKENQLKHSPVWKPLLLAICSCYLCYPEIVENTLEEVQHDGFIAWANALFSICSTKFEHGLSTESEMKLTVMTLAKLLPALHMRNQIREGLLWECLAATMEVSVRLKQVLEEGQENDDENASDEDNDQEDDEDSDDDDDDNDDDDDDDIHEETEEEFLERCAQAAIDLENGTGVEEVDEEDQEQEIELGELDEIDALNIVLLLIEKHHQILLQGPKMPQLVSSFVDAFPESAIFFKQYPL